jgi:hypothetical protein
VEEELPWPEEPPLTRLRETIGPGSPDPARLKDLVARADALAAAGSAREAAQLYEAAAAETAFADQASADERRRAQSALPRALLEAGLCRAALDASTALLKKRDDPRVPLGVRVATDAALKCGREAEAEALAALPPETPEASYLAAKGLLETGSKEELGRARVQLLAIPPVHRLAAPARYLAALVAVDLGDAATGRLELWSLAQPRVSAAGRELFEDARTPGVRDLARLALGRLMHEAGKEREAMGAYALVPEDSPRAPAARFEQGWAAYEAKEHLRAEDLAQEVLRRDPAPAVAAEALLLSAHAALARGRGDLAGPRFSEAAARFSAYARDAERAAAAQQPTPGEEKLRKERAALRRDLAGVPRLAATWRAAGGAAWELPRPERVDAGSRAAAGLASLARRLAAAARAQSAGPDEVEKARAAFSEIAALADSMPAPPAVARFGALPGPEAIVPAFAAEVAFVEALAKRAEKAGLGEPPAADPARAVAARERMNRLAAEAGLGQVDGVLQDKRRLEKEIQQLARGEVPPALMGAAIRGGMLREDEEYWPYEGEYWPDEVELLP